MFDFLTIVGVIAASLIALGLILPGYIMLLGYTRKRLARCPETGAITLVEFGRIATKGESQLGVKSCELWPEKKECARGCVSRCYGPRESSPFDLDSLRPFAG